jgi:hypothetical protein
MLQAHTAPLQLRRSNGYLQAAMVCYRLTLHDLSMQAHVCAMVCYRLTLHDLSIQARVCAVVCYRLTLHDLSVQTRVRAMAARLNKETRVKFLDGASKYY